MRIYIPLPHPFFVFELSGGKTMADKKTQGARDCNVVAQERIWEEAVHREANAAKQWESRWGFLTEYDLKGNPIEKKVLPEKMTYYDSQLPHTQSKTIGASVATSNGKTMMELERLTCYRKKRTDIRENYKYS